MIGGGICGEKSNKAIKKAWLKLSFFLDEGIKVVKNIYFRKVFNLHYDIFEPKTEIYIYLGYLELS